MQPCLQLNGVSKRYPGTLAVSGVDFDLFPGEVHALLGENGAGKSTLMKMIAGSFHDYTGSIFVNGEKVDLHSPALAKQHGIQMIHQELSLALPLSVAENVLVGRLPRKGIFLDKSALIRSCKEVLELVGLGDLDPMRPMYELSQSEAQLVEIAKALGNNPKILVMDEPTSALSREQVEQLFTIIHSLKERGLGIIYISHHLPEVFEVADRITVMRDGRKISSVKSERVSQEQLIEMMIGRLNYEESLEKKIRVESKEGTAALRVDNLSRYGFFHDVSFEARPGEILGIGGLAGSGRTELARAIVGLDPVDAGTVFLSGEEVRIRNMNQAIRLGIAYLTENRKHQGLALRLSIEENVFSSIIFDMGKGLLYSSRSKRGILTQLMDELDVNPRNPELEVANLSGGNQQKVLLAKWLAIRPKILVLDEPTRGVDIGSKTMIHNAVRRLANQGCTVIVISSDLPELVSLSERVLVMRRGHIVGEIPGNECTEEQVLLAANGGGRFVHVS
ncbi:sugar ABC transporter ATP-binding protein [Alicyclobacillus fastidiosus]|uniref:Sugar ABC transporter ATP-binding protein n=1 Tax=Alicyclobacillus fastidiosus TaxID=392011 RepID=A0ABY6ZNI7_9BACL|nr:sugar ABC transporter ATP-binding protein [Alicyclobacillus fastidiosus]WAH44397.1 sugar ABC transporter ATP-binding protein [Alicyclobacillus fastidiosus]GMA60735.1 ribose import ATP-binding protein RbsA [Alicyclobacillus fastidiosus]